MVYSRRESIHAENPMSHPPGAGLGFSIGLAATPGLAVEGVINGGLLGIGHGLIACSLFERD